MAPDTPTPEGASAERVALDGEDVSTAAWTLDTAAALKLAPDAESVSAIMQPRDQLLLRERIQSLHADQSGSPAGPVDGNGVGTDGLVLGGGVGREDGGAAEGQSDAGYSGERPDSALLAGDSSGAAEGGGQEVREGGHTMNSGFGAGPGGNGDTEGEGAFEAGHAGAGAGGVMDASEERGEDVEELLHSEGTCEQAGGSREYPAASYSERGNVSRDTLVQRTPGSHLL